LASVGTTAARRWTFIDLGRPESVRGRSQRFPASVGFMHYAFVMSFGKNPYVSKAQAAELKAEEALDTSARERAYREAAHEWERAAAREAPGKRRSEYSENAAKNRDLADGQVAEAPAPSESAAPVKKPLLN
jgi:hypothetical protein